jgi:hypothetical protein
MRFSRTVPLLAPRAVWLRPLSAGKRPTVTTFAALFQMRQALVSRSRRAQPPASWQVPARRFLRRVGRYATRSLPDSCFGIVSERLVSTSRSSIMDLESPGTSGAFFVSLRIVRFSGRAFISWGPLSGTARCRPFCDRNTTPYEFFKARVLMLHNCPNLSS